MSASLNHVSLSVRDLERSTRFYVELFGMEPVPTPNFGFPVRWLRVGDLQLHLFERPDDPPRHHHVALAVDDFPAFYRRAEKLDIFDRDAFGHHFFELPGDVAQLYVRDPGGNLVEVDAPGASALPESLRASLRRLEDVHPQDEENRRATLFLAAAEPVSR